MQGAYLHPMKFIGFFLIALCLLACKDRKTQPVHVNDASGNFGNAAILIELETTPCRGYCPIYKIKIMDDGKATYEGVRFTDPLGTHGFTLTQEELKALKEQITTTNLWQYPESFPVTIADAPGASLTVWQGDKSKVVRGSIERPKPIVFLDELVRSLARAHGFSLESKDPDELPANKKELIVKLIPTINAGNWIHQINKDANLNLRLVRRLGADNIWLVGYNPDDMDTNNLLTVLRANGDVMNVQENKAVQERKEK
jgi:Domain of unknown function (DUF6438)